MSKTIPNKLLKVESLVRRKIETTYEYIPLLGQVLGYWRRAEEHSIGDKIELHIQTSLEDYDRLLINGKEIKIPDQIKKKELD